MVKSVYLYEPVSQNFLDIPPDKSSLTIGRAIDCDFTTPNLFAGISRLQALIQYFPNGDIKLTQRSIMSPTHYRFGEDSWEQLYTGRTEIIIPGSEIRFDNDYMMRVLPFNHKLVQERMSFRGGDTVIEYPN